MSPFTPQKRDNMIAWLAARCDFPDYGKMLFYELPKEKLIYGPNQIGAMIDQNTTISQQLTLWDQKGSKVIRGKLVVIPIASRSFTWSRCICLPKGRICRNSSESSWRSDNRVVMEPTLDEALTALFRSPGQGDRSPRNRSPGATTQWAAGGSQDSADRGAEGDRFAQAPAE